MRFMANEFELAFVLTVLAVVSFWSYKKKFLDNEGLLIAFILGLSVFIFGGIPGFATLVVFFGVAELGTVFGAGKRAKVKHALRGTGNILGNALAGTVALLFNSPVGFFCAISRKKHLPARVRSSPPTPHRDSCVHSAA
jgi:uncharacterized membrane protein